jgi:hypothetical protein
MKTRLRISSPVCCWATHLSAASSMIFDFRLAPAKSLLMLFSFLNRLDGLRIVLFAEFILGACPWRSPFSFPLTSQSKTAERGGLSDDDRHVAYFASNPQLKKRLVIDPVSTRQVAPTILAALGLDPKMLKGAVAEGTAGWKAIWRKRA